MHIVGANSHVPFCDKRTDMHIQGIRYKSNFKGAKLAGQLRTLHELLQHMGLEFCLDLLTYLITLHITSMLRN